MKPTWILSLVGTLMALWAVSARAGSMGPMRAHEPEQIQGIVSLDEVRPLQRASDLRHCPVSNVDASLRGHVADLVLTMDRRHVDYAAVVFYDDVEQLYMIPFLHLRSTVDGRTLICDVTSAQRRSLANVSNRAWARNRDLGRVSRLIGLRAKDTAGQAAGRIRDLLIESDSGRVREVTVGMGGFLGFREDLASLEWPRVTLRPEYAQLDISTEKLAERCYPKEDYWQRLGFAGERETPESEIPMPTPPLTPLNPYY